MEDRSLLAQSPPTAGKKSKLPNPSQEPSRAEISLKSLRPVVVTCYFFCMLSAVTALRLIARLASTGEGFASGVITWASDPFVYVFNRLLRIPVLKAGAGTLELGSLLALLAYVTATFGILILLRSEVEDGGSSEDAG